MNKVKDALFRFGAVVLPAFTAGLVYGTLGYVGGTVAPQYRAAEANTQTIPLLMGSYTGTLIGLIDFSSIIPPVLSLSSAKTDWVTLYINSPGGSVDAAQILADAMRTKLVTCYVDRAYSAALQIVMPACTAVYAPTTAFLGFHNAVYQYDTPITISPPSALEMFRVLKSATATMAQTMNTRYGGDSLCPSHTMEKWSNLATTCTEAMMYEESEFNPLTFNALWPNNPPLLVLNPSGSPDVTPKPTSSPTAPRKNLRTE